MLAFVLTSKCVSNLYPTFLHRSLYTTTFHFFFPLFRDAFKVNSRCALWPSPEECPSTSTTAFKTTVEPRIEETTTAPVDGTTSARTTTSAPVDGTTPARTTTSAPVDGTTPEGTTTSAPVDETTQEGATTTAPVDGTTPEGTTLPIVSTTDASSTNAKVIH